MSVDLALKYRPKNWEDVVGQAGVVKSLRATLKTGGKRSFLFVGPSGTGKTTLARLIARVVGCTGSNILEIDAATYTGIDAMRAVSENTAYKAFGDSPIKVVIIDEAHSLSKQAWQSLLKSVEEPPEHVYWIFCTTEAGKVPKTIETRCAKFTLAPVKSDDLFKLLSRAVQQEGYKTTEEVLDVIVRESLGSPRQALTYLEQCSGCKTARDAKELLQRADEEGDAIVLPRSLIKGGLTWQKAMKLLEPLREQSAESIRLMILAYFTTVLFGCKTDDSAGRVLTMMDCFSEPYNTSEGFAPLLLSIGQILYQ